MHCLPAPNVDEGPGNNAQAWFPGRLLAVNVLWRILGLHALAELGARLPAPLARLFNIGLVVVSNLVPLVGVLAGWMSFADVFVVYWLETVVLGLFAVVRIATATRDRALARRERVQTAMVFLLHYGLIAAGLGFFVFWMVNAAVAMGEDSEGIPWLAEPPTLAWGTWIFAGLGIILSHLYTLTVYWFGREERRLYTPWQCMWPPYPRILVLYPFYALNIVVLIVLILFAPVLLVVLLVACKLGLDLTLFALDRYLAGRRLRAAPAREAAAVAGPVA